jgi:putative FmdB family regulatory protein
MAAYDYRCRVCDTVFETRRAITEQASDVQCPAGHTDVARIWSAVAITGSARPGAAPAPAPAMAGGGGCCGGGCCG